jgi:hypothetical protein
MTAPPPWLIQRLHDEAQAEHDRKTWEQGAHVEVGFPVPAVPAVPDVPQVEPYRSDNHTDSGFEIVDFTI